MLGVKASVQPVYVSRVLNMSVVRYWGVLLPPMLLAGIVVLVGRSGLFRLAPAGGYGSLAIAVLPVLASFRILFLSVRTVPRIGLATGGRRVY